MDTSKSLCDIGAANLRIMMEYKKCGILDMERQGTLAKLICGRFCSRFVVVSKTKCPSTWCLFCYKDQFSRRADAVYILKECSRVEEYTDTKDKDVIGFVVIFTDPNRKNLVFACPSQESKQIWTTALASAIIESHSASAIIESPIESHSNSGDSGIASEGSIQDLLIDPLANDYDPQLKIRQSRYGGYVDINDVAVLPMEATESKFKKEREDKSLKNTRACGDIKNSTVYMNQYSVVKKANVASSDVGAASQATLGCSVSYLDVGVGQPSAEPISCGCTQETHQPKDLENTCPKTIEESSDESSVKSTSRYENLDVATSSTSSTDVEDLTGKEITSFTTKYEKSPKKLDLDKDCKRYGIDSVEVQTKCRKICADLKHASEKILYVWPAHWENNKDMIIFVIIITKALVNEPEDIGIVEGFDVFLRTEFETNTENRAVIDQEVETETRIDILQIEKLQQTIADNFPILQKEHSNITMVSASPFKSTGFRNGNHTTKREDCIVIFVHVKGLIPIKEKVFPKSLDGFTVDVREAMFKPYVGGKPSDRHDSLKIGCAIGPSERECTGTLGGFIEHENHGLCAFTCAHVLIDADDMNSETPRKIDCVQPSREYENPESFGKLVNHAIGNSSTGQGFDVALIKLDKDGRSICCDFPDISKTDLEIAGFDGDHTLRYTSGEVYTSSDIAKYRDSRLIKFGASSLLKRGVFGFKGALIANNSLGPYFGRYDLIINNLIQINHIAKCGEFATTGDSGALVFSVSDQGLVAIGLLIGGWDGCTYAAPICDILQAVNVSSPYTLKSFSEANNDNTSTTSPEQIANGGPKLGQALEAPESTRTRQLQYDHVQLSKPGTKMGKKVVPIVKRDASPGFLNERDKEQNSRGQTVNRTLKANSIKI